MAIYRYIVTVETNTGPEFHTERDDIQSEIDSNLESAIVSLGIEHFTIEPLPLRAYPGEAFLPAPMSPDGRYLS